MSVIQTALLGASVVDLFAGSGALGIEALSRGARHVAFVDSSAAAIRAIRANLAAVAASPDSFRIERVDAVRYLAARRGEERFDIAFADPPYQSGLAAEVTNLFLTHPFADLLCVEHDPRETLPGTPDWERTYGDTALTLLQRTE